MIVGAAVFIGALTAAVVVTTVVGRLARITGAVDMPGARKVHEHPIPRIGGVVFVVATLVVGVPTLIAGPIRLPPPVIVMLIAAAGVFVVGLLDDVVTVSSAGGVGPSPSSGSSASPSGSTSLTAWTAWPPESRRSPARRCGSSRSARGNPRWAC